MSINQQPSQELFTRHGGLEQPISLEDPILTRLANANTVGEMILAACDIPAIQEVLVDVPAIKIDLTGSDRQPLGRS
jgi:hypothetical protein